MRKYCVQPNMFQMGAFQDGKDAETAKRSKQRTLNIVKVLEEHISNMFVSGC